MTIHARCRRVPLLAIVTFHIPPINRTTTLHTRKWWQIMFFQKMFFTCRKTHKFFTAEQTLELLHFEWYTVSQITLEIWSKVLNLQNVYCLFCNCLLPPMNVVEMMIQSHLSVETHPTHTTLITIVHMTVLNMWNAHDTTTTTFLSDRMILLKVCPGTLSAFPTDSTKITNPNLFCTRISFWVTFYKLQSLTVLPDIVLY